MEGNLTFNATKLCSILYISAHYCVTLCKIVHYCVLIVVELPLYSEVFLISVEKSPACSIFAVRISCNLVLGARD